MYLNSFNYFRAIVIIFIVVGHCLLLADFSNESIFGKMIYNFTKGGSFLFVFISGFLFHHIFYKNFDYRSFINKKFKKVFIPYAILSIIPIVYLVFIKDVSSNAMPNYFLPTGDSWIAKYFIPFIKYYSSGRQVPAFWYIPFIMLVFLLSPLHIQFIKKSMKVQIIIMSLFMICSILLIHRTLLSAGIYIFQSVFYYTGIYLLGIICSQKKNLIYTKLHGKELLLIFIAIILAFIQAYIGRTGNYYNSPFEYIGVDLMAIQKMFLCVFFVLWLHRFEKKKSILMDTIASTSFAIFFIHTFLISLFFKIKSYFNFSFPPDSLIVYLLVSFAILSLSVILALLLKQIFPKHSKYIIGY